MSTLAALLVVLVRTRPWNQHKHPPLSHYVNPVPTMMVKFSGSRWSQWAIERANRNWAGVWNHLYSQTTFGSGHGFDLISLPTHRSSRPRHSLKVSFNLFAKVAIKREKGCQCTTINLVLTRALHSATLRLSSLFFSCVSRQYPLRTSL